ncbi:hypothetical protein QTG56_25610 (plasmid) [Rossellomorea sp. AcN35-11]|nr:hypothetical protein [Rossellomorea aquimaris]WJV31993.1 hypothetical protein QTG56_25610 [Rossellomorea sp. AcN35-11]
MKIDIGDFVEFRKSRWIVINVNEDMCDLMNGYQEQHWNAHIEELKIIAKFQ